MRKGAQRLGGDPMHQRFAGGQRLEQRHYLRLIIFRAQELGYLAIELRQPRFQLRRFAIRPQVKMDDR